MPGEVAERDDAGRWLDAAMLASMRPPPAEVNAEVLRPERLELDEDDMGEKDYRKPGADEAGMLRRTCLRAGLPANHGGGGRTVEEIESGKLFPPQS